MSQTAAILAAAAPAADATSSDKGAEGEAKKVKFAPCINVQREETIRDLFRKLRHEVAQGCAEVGTKLLFPTEGALSRDDVKNLHQQARILVNQAEDYRWNAYSAAIVKSILATIEGFQAKARTTKEQLDALRENTPEDMRAFLPAFPSKVRVPFPALVSAWPQGANGQRKEESEILMELDRLVREGKVPTAALANGAPKGKTAAPADFYVSVDFQANAPKTEEAPQSGEAPKSKAA